MNELETRRQLLRAESEFNRILLAHEWQGMISAARAAGDEVKRAGRLVAGGAALAGTLGLFRLSRGPKTRPRQPWIHAFFRLARWGLPVWMELRKGRR